MQEAARDALMLSITMQHVVIVVAGVATLVLAAWLRSSGLQCLGASLLAAAVANLAGIYVENRSAQGEWHTAIRVALFVCFSLIGYFTLGTREKPVTRVAFAAAMGVFGMLLWIPFVLLFSGFAFGNAPCN